VEINGCTHIKITLTQAPAIIVQRSKAMTKKDGNSQQRIDEIVVELLANELSVPKIAKEFGVSKSYVYMVNSGECGRMPGFKYPVREKKYPPREPPTDAYGEPV